MSLDGTYSGLKASIAGFLNRADLTDQIPDFVAMWEAKANRVLDVRQMVSVNNSFSITGETVSVPAGFAGVKSFRLATAPVSRLEYVKPDEMDSILKAASYSSGKPLYYTVVGDTFVFSPVPDATYTARLRYRTTIPALSDTNPTNWLLTRHPDVYLYGSLMAAEAYMKDDDRLQVWGGLLQASLGEMAYGDALEQAGSEPRAKTRTFG